MTLMDELHYSKSVKMDLTANHPTWWRMFVAALYSVGTTAVLAGAGAYLHRRGMIDDAGKKAMSRYSQQISLPALFFSKIVGCRGGGSTSNGGKVCPSVVENLGQVWILFVWPIFVVGCGFIIGYIMTGLARTPKWQRPSILIAIAFANSNGFPLTLLQVLYETLQKSGHADIIDPSAFLSVYLLLYPCLQWGIGGFLLAPCQEEVTTSEPRSNPFDVESHSTGKTSLATTASLESIHEEGKEEEKVREHENLIPHEVNYLSPDHSVLLVKLEPPPLYAATRISLILPRLGRVKNALQPPVIAALLGIMIASVSSLRGLLVPSTTAAANTTAPLGWIFEGIKTIGSSAVPINMAVLGVSLSKAALNRGRVPSTISRKTIAAAVLGKLVLLPLIGMVAVRILKDVAFPNMPKSTAIPLLMVLMIVCITPTATNIMVMVDVFGSDAKEGISTLILWEYIFVPIIIPISMMGVVQIATS